MSRNRDYVPIAVPSYLNALLAIESDAGAPAWPTPVTSAAGGGSGDPMDD
jgi:hypothetical protein